MPYLDVLSKFRDNVREFAKEKKPHTDFLSLSDKLRDEDLVELGVLLDDQEGKVIEWQRTWYLTKYTQHVT